MIKWHCKIKLYKAKPIAMVTNGAVQGIASNVDKIPAKKKPIIPRFSVGKTLIINCGIGKWNWFSFYRFHVNSPFILKF